MSTTRYSVIVKFSDGSSKSNVYHYVDMKNIAIQQAFQDLNSMEIEVFYSDNNTQSKLIDHWIKNKPWWKIFSTPQWKNVT